MATGGGDRDVVRALADRASDAEGRAARLREQLRSLTDAAAGANADDEHDPEGATLAYEREQMATLLRQAEADLAELAAARVRLAEGSYGICEVCGEAIGDGRLAARPTARTCLVCAGRRVR